MTVLMLRVVSQTLLQASPPLSKPRAGEQGRGFAVVADEVRQLAKGTSEATQEITVMIDIILKGSKNAVVDIDQAVSIVNDGVILIEQVGNSIQQLSLSTQNVGEKVYEVSNALREQDAASSEIARNTEQIAHMIESNSFSVQSIAEAALGLGESAASLTQSTQRFNSKSLDIASSFNLSENQRSESRMEALDQLRSI